jgi:hypothetical protein
MNDKIDFLENLLCLQGKRLRNMMQYFIMNILATMEDKKVGIDGYSKLWDKVRKN